MMTAHLLRHNSNSKNKTKQETNKREEDTGWRLVQDFTLILIKNNSNPLSPTEGQQEQRVGVSVFYTRRNTQTLHS